VKSSARSITPLRAWLLALVLVLAQAAGIAHRVAHTALPGSTKAQSSWSADHKAGAADCRLLDQLTHADALCAPVLAALPEPVSAQDGLTAPLWPVRAGAAALYQARAPPLNAPG
jgi:hypothetical protein